MAYVATQDPVRRHARHQSGNQAVLRRLRGRQAGAAALHGYQEVHLVSARHLARSCFGRCEWEEVSGKGKIYTLSVMERAEVRRMPSPMSTLAEGPTMMTNIVDCDFKDAEDRPGR